MSQIKQLFGFESINKKQEEKTHCEKHMRKEKPSLWGYDEV